MNSKSFKIKDIFADHWDAFLLEGYPIRPSVLKNVNKIVNCGDPSMGHALYYCDHCGKFKRVAFTCKSRFCNSCGAKYIQDRASSISSKLIHCKHRHLVFTIPEQLRIFFRRDRSLLHLLFGASAKTILYWCFKLNKSENFKPGFISTLHTFGRDLIWNPHKFLGDVSWISMFFFNILPIVLRYYIGTGNLKYPYHKIFYDPNINVKIPPEIGCCKGHNKIHLF